jgi:murein DD-endopeptidase MepM/ murein hydrolase activator NlpD
VQYRQTTIVFSLLAAGLLGGVGHTVIARQISRLKMKGYDITASGLKPRYPSGFACSPLTSLYASWTDVDGSRRSERHSGVDGGRLGDPIVAPGPGTVRAVWQANWGWGVEGALMMKHTRWDLNLPGNTPFYYSEFDHLKYSDVSGLKAGQKIARGEVLAHVFRPGGNEGYLPEVHWEVWEVSGEDDLVWRSNEFGGKYWVNETARLIDPLYLLARHAPPQADGGVTLAPFVTEADYSGFPGFTYILPCQQKQPKGRP